MRILDTINGGIVFLIIVAITALIAVVAYIIYRFTHPKLKSDEENKTEKDYAAEELNRVLEPINDEETAKQVSEYKEEDD